MYTLKWFFALLMLSMSVASVAYAAKQSPSSGLGGMPYQAPLQPLPQGVGANLSNNIQQTETSGPPASAATIPVLESASGEVDSAAPPAHSAKSSAETRSRSKGHVVIWTLIIGCVIGFVSWWWYARRTRTST